MRRFLPKTLFWRVLLILISPLILVQFIGAWIFFDRLWDNVTWRLSVLSAADIAYIVYRVDSTSEQEQAGMLSTLSDYFDMRLDFIAGESFPLSAPQTSSLYQDAPLGLLRKTLSDKIDNRFYISILNKNVNVLIEFGDGLLHILFPRKRIFSSTIYVFLFGMFISSVILGAIAIIILRNQIRPIVRLTETADAFGKGQEEQTSLVPRGALEVRRAAVAFNRMQERIRRQIRQRTNMLTGVSHDLRTPITRLKLRLALLSDSTEGEYGDMKRDLQDMEAMVQAYLTFAEGEGEEPAKPQDIASLLRDIVVRCRSGQKGKERVSAKIDLHIEGDIEMPIKEHAFCRCVENLLGNALRYGKHVRINMGRRGEHLQITIDDDGCGIPEDKRDQVFRPFYRLEKSRNRNTGGFGLGLAIARDIARVHGGDVDLSESPQGGVRATLHLPL